jgi:hypothetical protein
VGLSRVKAQFVKVARNKIAVKGASPLRVQGSALAPRNFSRSRRMRDYG